MGRPAGAASTEVAVEVARIPGIDVIGLLTHAGHAYRATDPGQLRTAAEGEALDMVETADLCRKEGVDVRVVSVGSTPTARTAAGIAGVTEIRPGTYVFNDVQQMRLGVAMEQTCGAHVLATVVARPTSERFVIDGGTKAFSSDGGDGPPFPGRGVVAGRPDLVLDFMSEEHGVGHITDGGDLAIGDRLEVIPLHACSAVNLFDLAYGVRHDVVELEIPIVGRGRSQ
jgi:D-serine deaminase-like pyridoxal phosphate-dependent protein